ncbi:MAG: hypothetical protein COB02_08880 [Candidatus Cloacimonadota bacterium]|nr:MAG: hypothetical protein COB02_08880 [Candidatus Cloacimonadota bacterium]
MIKFFIVLSISSIFCFTSCTANSFIDDLHRISKKSSLFQRIFVKNKLKKIQEKYRSWITSSSDEDFKEHLAYSKHGSKLLSHLKSDKIDLNLLKKKYQKLIDQNLLGMNSVVEKFYSKKRNFKLVYEQVSMYTMAFIQVYNALLTKKISHTVFKVEEAKIVEHLKSLRMSSASKQMIRISIMLQTQQMGLSYDRAKN